MGEISYLEKNRNYFSKIILFVIIALVIIYAYLIISNKTNLLFTPAGIPTINSVNILSENNLSGETLFGYCNPGDTDPDDENLSCNYIWYKDDLIFDSGTITCVSNVNNTINLSASQVSVGTWFFSCQAYDEFNYSSWVNSSIIETDSLPIVVFNPQTSLGTLKQNFIILNISGLDTNLDKIEAKLYNSSGLIYENNSDSEIYVYLSGLADGIYTLNVVVNDTFGDISSVTRLIKLDNHAPTIALRTEDPAYGASISFQMIASDSVSGIDCFSFKEGSNSYPYFNLSCDGLFVNKTRVPPGVYRINLSVNDTAGNYGVGTFFISILTDQDVDSPVISNINVSTSLSSAVISWTTSELSDSRISYGINSSLSSTAYSATQLVSHSFNLDNLLNSTQYFFNISSCDGSGNCATYISNFTTLSSIVTTSGTNTNNENEPDVFSASYTSLVSGYEKRGLIVGDRIILSKTTNERYNLTIVSVGTSNIKAKINNQALFTISLGVNQRIDVNSDSVNDFDILLKNSSNSKATILITLIVPSGSGGGNQNNVGGTGSGLGAGDASGGQEIPDGDQDVSILAYILWSLVIIILVSLIILFVLKKKEIIEFFENHFSKKPSEAYIRTIEMIRSAEEFIQNGQREKASAIYGIIRNLFPSLRKREREMLKPRVMRLFGLISRR